MPFAASNAVDKTLFQPAFSRCASLLAGVAILFAGTGASANSAWFTRTWRTDEGLLNNTVPAVAQTADGFVWVGTSSGLVRFDGVNFFEVPYLSGTNPDPNVRILAPSRAGGLWIVPEIGPIVCLNSDLSRASLPVDQLPKEQCIAFTESREGFWAGYSDGSICRVYNGQVRQYGTNDGVPTGTLNSLVVDREENVWLAKGGTVTILRGEKFERITFYRQKIHVLPARTNGVWITAGFLVLRATADGQLTEFGNIPAATPTAIARTLIEDQSGKLWIGTDGGGLFHHDGTAFQSVEVSHPFVSCMTQDAEGNVWAGTLGGGLNRVFPGAVRLEGKEEGRSLVAIRSVAEDADGVMWGATQNGDLVARVNGAWTPRLVWTGTSNLSDVDCVILHQSNLWFGVRGRVMRYRDGTLKTYDTRGLSSMVTGMLSTKSGDLWLSVLGRLNTGASVLRIRDEKVEQIKLPPAVGRRAVLAEDAEGKIWAGTASGQLFRLEGEEFQEMTALTSVSGRAIRNLQVTPDGSLWIAYAGLGLGRIKNGVFTRITSEHGLPENYLSQIKADAEGWLWFGGDRGIFKVRQANLDAVMDRKAASVSPIRYGRNEGFYSQQTDATIWSGALAARDGRIWMPMRSALAVIDPRIRREQLRPPAVCLTRVAVDDRLVGTYGSADGSKEIANLKTLKTPLYLQPRHHKVEFAFSALTFAAPEDVRFRYRLDGFDEDWVDAGAQRGTRYSRLPAGEYTFRVAACNSDGVWNESRIPVTLIVTPFFWQTSWFQVSALLIFSSVLAGIVRYIFTRRLRRRLVAMEQQAALDRSRMAGMAEVAASVMHNVGNVLNSVNVSSTMARDRLRHVKTANLHKAVALLNEHGSNLPEFFANDPKGKQLPAYLASLAQHLTDEQEEILRELSVLDENIEHIKEIVVAQQRYAKAAGVQETFKPADVVDDAIRIHTGALEESRVEVIRDFQDVPPVVTDKHKVLQILVTLIGNARQALETAKSDNKRLVVRVGKNGGDRVVISVCDNGIGIPKENLTRIFQQGFAISKSGQGMGLHSGANAAHELGGSLEAQSDGPGTGATFTLEFPAKN